jgi:hypothetical protein
MDEEMGEREGKEQKVAEIMKHRPGIAPETFINYRLTQEWEVPEWIRVKPVDDSKEKDNLLNLGKRNRKTINSSYALSD